MKYEQKAAKFKEMTYGAQGLVFDEGVCRPVGDGMNPKWKSKEELIGYLGSFGGVIKQDKRRKRGYLVSVLTDDMVAEVPLDFAEKVLAFGFP